MKSYDPRSVTVAFGGRVLSGYAPGTFVEVEYDEEGSTMEVGIDGEGCRAINPNQAARVRVQLMPSADDNDILSGLYLADRRTGAGLQPILVKDGSGRSLHAGEQSFIERLPTRQYAKEANTPVEWVFRCDRLIGYLGGN